MENSFFQQIRTIYGEYYVCLCKEQLNLTKTLANLRNRKMFLLQCRSKNIIPNHINNNIKCVLHVQTDNHPFNNLMDKSIRKFRKSILDIEIKITLWKIESISKKLNYNWLIIEGKIVAVIFKEFKLRVSKRYANLFKNTKMNNMRKLLSLENKFNNVTLNKNDSNIFNYVENLDIPLEVRRILGAGPKFSLPLTASDVNITSIIKDFEYCVLKSTGSGEEKEILRNRGVNIITNFYNRPWFLDRNKNIQLLKDQRAALKFKKEHPEIIISHSDKGNSTVIISKIEYINEMTKMFGDTSKYKILAKDPTRYYERKSNDLILHLQRSKFVNTGVVSTKYDCKAPKAYGLRKTHKSNVAYRPVISNIDAPSYELAKLVHSILHPVCREYNRNIMSSFQVIEKVRDMQLPKDYILVSMDVVSLFPSIPQSLVMKIIDEEWDDIICHTKIPKHVFKKIIQFIFESSFFVFNGITYLQLDGSAMGNPASPVLANLVVEYVFKKVINNLPFIVFFGFYYVDDSLFAIPKDKGPILLEKFNNFHSSIQFTIEYEKEGRLPFLDIELIRKEDGNIVTNWYVKPTSSGRVMNFLSLHPTYMKINNVKNMLHRAISLSNTEFVWENINKIKNILNKNNYPRSWSNNVINNYLRTTSLIVDRLPADNVIKFLKFPNIPVLSNKIIQLFKEKDELKIVLYNIKTTKHLFTRIKDAEEHKNRSNVVYQIFCKNCTKNYVGQTSQRIEKRIQQHALTCREEKYREKSSLAEHHHSLTHSFDFENIKILDNEKNQDKRRLSEMIFITMQGERKVNARTDTDNLSTSYKYLIEKYKKKRDRQ